MRRRFSPASGTASGSEPATPALITAISLVAVFFNAASGSAAYARQRRIDFRSGLVFAAFTHAEGLRRAAAISVGVIFGAQLGARQSRHLSGPVIQRLLAAGLFGVAMRLALSVVL